MSNYTFVIHNETATDRVNDWLRRHASASDVVRVELRRGRQVVIISKDAARSSRAGAFFRGTVVAPESDAMIFGVDGWLAAPRRVRDRSGDHAGEYISATWGGRHMTIDRDVFGGARLLHTAGPGFAAASDSILVLASLRHALGLAVTPDREVLFARTALSAIAGQQISPDTIISEIEHVPAGRGLRLDGFDWNLTGATMGRRISSARPDPVGTIRAGATNIGRTVATLARIDGWAPNLSLSGGYDSRLVLAAIVATGTNSHYTARTADHGPKFARDLQIGTDLARLFGVPVDTFEDPLTAEKELDELTLWSVSLLGSYDAYGPVRTSRRRVNTFGVTGLGAEIHKGQWGWCSLADLAEVAAGEGPTRDALAAQLQKAAVSIDADPALRNASELYYLGYRNGIHGSAGHIGVQMTTVHPVMQLQLAQLGHMPVDGRRRTPETLYRGSPSGIADHSILLAPEVAVHEYDDQTRNLTSAYVEDRLRALGGPITRIEPLTVYGHPDAVVDGPSDLSMSVARDLGLIGRITADEVLKRGKGALDLLSDPALRAIYEGVFENARWRIEKNAGNLRLAHLSPARLSMLEVFRLAS